MKLQDWINLATASRFWLRYNWKKLAITAGICLLLGFCSGRASAAEPPSVSLQASVGAGNVPTLTWAAPWATSCTASGGWSGSKAASGSQALPAITSSTTFNLACSASVPADAAAQLSWTAPTQYTDGSPLPAADLDAFRIYQGASSSNLSRVAEVAGTARDATRTDLAAGRHYFAVTAVTVNGAESGLSAIGSKVATAGGTVSASNSVTVRVANAPVLTVQQTVAHDVQMQGLRFVLGRPVGEVPLGTACHADFALEGGWYRVEREHVAFGRASRSAVVVARCA